MVLGEAGRAPCRSRPRAIERRVTLSRDRRIITRKRNKLTIVAAAGALGVATAATAAAVVWPSGAPAGKAGTAFATLSQPVHRPAVQPSVPQSADRQAVLTARAQQEPATHRAVVTQAPKRQMAGTAASQAARHSQHSAQQAVKPATQRAVVTASTPVPPAPPAPSATPTTTPSPARLAPRSPSRSPC